MSIKILGGLVLDTQQLAHGKILIILAAFRQSTLNGMTRVILRDWGYG